MKNQHIDIDNARLDDQRDVMKQIMDADHCPFCRENLEKYHKQPILKEGQYWLVTTNQWPYNYTKKHFMLIYKEHATQLSELDPKAGQELLEIVQWLEKEHKIPGGGFAMRFGDTEFSAGSVAHIHVQVVVPDLEHPEYKPVRITIGRDPK